MTETGTQDNPYSAITLSQAYEHWKNGGGEAVYVDMASHMSSGGGSVFSISSFTADFKSELPPENRTVTEATI